MPSGSEKPLERGKDLVANVDAKLSQGFEDRFILHTRRTLSERYAQARVYFHVHVLVSVNGNGTRKSSDWCIGLHCSSEDLYQPIWNTSYVDGSPRIPPNPFGAADDGVQEPVLIDAVQLMDDPKGITSKCVPSVVRLKQLNDCLSIWMPSPNLVKPATMARLAPASTLHDSSMESLTAHPSVPVPVLIPEDRELRAIREIVWKGFGVDRRERERQIVEGGAEIVQAVSNEGRELLMRWLLGGGEKKPCPLRLNFMPDRMVISVQPSLLLSLQIHQVVECPIELQAMVERMSHGA